MSPAPTLPTPRGDIRAIYEALPGDVKRKVSLHDLRRIHEAIFPWKPISTAPKDREIILGHAKRGGEPAVVSEGYWQEAREERASEFHATGAYLGEYSTGEVHPAFWMSTHGGFSEEHPPTHWMEKPEPPPCLCCNGHGELGGLLPNGGGYDSEPCPDCNP